MPEKWPPPYAPGLPATAPGRSPASPARRMRRSPRRCLCPLSPEPPQASTQLPAWAAQLADKELAACGSGPTAAQLTALGREAATEEVNRAIADCQGAGGGDHGKGKAKH